ncbi:uncharacterized protein LOC134254903 [Saccostrea cucullata]|uniref:uncharacterized protein LOC134254903 n=1 Tax=Saccostrea cuccullata TaxID=36930 RepID=UPI002ED681CD
MVTAPDVTEEIYIRIEMDIHHTPGYACDDYLQIQEIITDFTLFKQCGKQTRNRIARGNKLMIIFFSNHDRLTDKGFRVRLKVSKILTKSTKSTKVPSPMSKTPMAPETKTTTKTKDSFPQRTKIGNKEIIRSTKTATITVVTTKKSRETNISTVFSNWKATKPTTPKVIMSEALSSTPTLYTSSQPPHSTTVIYKTSISAPVIITSGSSQSATSPEEPISSSIKLSTETSTTESIPINQEIVLLMMGIGVVEVTIIIVGVLAVKRFRQKKKSSRTSKEANDRRPVSRKTVFGIDNEYDTIPFDESDENPYKDLSEGVYDATSKRRSHVNGQRTGPDGAFEEEHDSKS